jgi:hypothetical protein
MTRCRVYKTVLRLYFESKGNNYQPLQRRTAMTKLTTFILGMCIVLASSGIALAHPNDGLEGFVIGGVGGAAIGHAVSGTPEGMIVGSLLGSTIGMLIDVSDNRHVVVVRDRHRHHRQWPDRHYRDRGPWSHRDDRHYYKKQRHYPRWERHRGRHLR